MSAVRSPVSARDNSVKGADNKVQRAPGLREASDLLDDSSAYEVVHDIEQVDASDFDARDSRTTGYSVPGPSSFTRPVSLFIGITGLALLFVAIVMIGRYTADPREFPVNEVEVAGTLDYTDRDRLRQTVIDKTRDGFYALKLDEIRKEVERMPWIARAHVRRISPDRVSIDVVEHEPAARWNDDGLISKKFEYFQPPQLGPDHIQRAEWQAYFAKFPQLHGSAGRHHDLLSALRAYQNYLTPFGARIEALREDSRQSQALLLDNNVTVRLGVEKQEERVQRFVDVYERLVTSLNGQPVKFDMRYANGFTMTRVGAGDDDAARLSDSFATLKLVSSGVGPDGAPTDRQKYRN